MTKTMQSTATFYILVGSVPAPQAVVTGVHQQQSSRPVCARPGARRAVQASGKRHACLAPTQHASVAERLCMRISNTRAITCLPAPVISRLQHITNSEAIKGGRRLRLIACKAWCAKHPFARGHMPSALAPEQ